MNAPRYARPHILNEIDPHNHHLIEASAGAGKTYTIEHLVIELLLRGVKLKKILLVTFTDKATQELRDRIRSKIRELVDFTGATDSQDYWELNDAAKALLGDALFEFEEASIETIHGYCNTVLREFAFENHLRFEMEQKNKKQVLQDLFHEHLRQSVLAKDSPLRQLLADYLAEHPNGLDLSEDMGFKQTLMQKAEKLATIKAWLLPDLARTDLVWREWREWFLNQPEISDIARLNLSKAHLTLISEVYASMRANLMENLVLSDVFTWMDQNEKGLNLLVKPKDWKFNKTRAKGAENPIMSLAEVPEQILALAKETMKLCKVSCSLEARLLLNLMPGLEEALAKKKALKGWFDFDDMISLVAKGLVGEGGDRLRDALRKKHSHALIDEFQDTDNDQWTIFSKVFLGSETHRLFLIGDPKQAIYRFRGADVHTYLDARDAIQRIGGRVIELGENFRSSPELIDGVNTVFSDPQLFKGRIQFQPVAAGKPDNRLTDGGEPAITCLFPDGVCTSGDAKNLFAVEIADRIQDLLMNPPGLPEGRPLAPRDIAILTRSRQEAERVGVALAQKGVAYAFYKQGGLFKTREAEEFYALLSAIENYRDDAHIFKALLTRFFPVDLEDLLKWRTAPEKYREWLTHWHKQIYLDRDYRALFGDIFEKTGLMERLLFLNDAEREVTNYEHLADILKQEGARLDLKQLLRRFKDFMEEKFEQDQDLLRLESESEAVQIMTIHASKGLEFPIVFLYGAYSTRSRPDWYHDFHDDEKGRVLDLGLNHADAHLKEKQDELERLYYVALTRAKFRLYITHNPPKKLTKTSHVLSGPLLRLQEMGSHGAIQFQTVVPHAPEGAGQQIPAPGSLHGWSPKPPDFGAASNRLREMRYERDLFRMTSYTRLAHHGPMETGLLAEGVTPQIQGLDEAPDAPSAQVLDLPKGRQTGICLHEILERVVDLKTTEFEDMEAWRDDENTRNVITPYLKRAGLAGFYETSAAVVWHALKNAVIEDQSVGGLPPGDRLHEIDFYYPVQKDWGNRQQTIILNGSIDLAFRHQDRHYFADWKSDTLEDYRPSALHIKVQEDYHIQIKIYLWAMLRWLGIADQDAYESKFGGLFYLFLRGMVGGDGVYFYRPDWDEALKYRAALEKMV